METRATKRQRLAADRIISLPDPVILSAAKTLIDSKIMETRALKGQRQRQGLAADRISNLPDPIIHKILSLLPIKSAARTRLLSKQWDYLWLSLPILDFSSVFRYTGIGDFQRIEYHNLLIKAAEFMRRVLSRRPKDSNIKVFHLVGHVKYSLLTDCIRRVARQDIEEIELDVCFKSQITLPPCLFTCNKLRVLKLHPNPDQCHFAFNPPFFVLPISLATVSDCFQFVHTLSLIQIKFTGCTSTIARFSVLKSLCLRNCSGIGHLNVNCPCLESLELDTNQASFVTIFAPMVENFTWADDGMVKKCSMDGFKCIKNCTIQFSILSMTKAKARLRTAASLISVLSSATNLHFGKQVIMMFSDTDLSGGLPCSFNNLVTLELCIGFKNYELTGMACLLRRTPILHTLTIYGDKRDGTFDPRLERWNIDMCQKYMLEAFRSFEHHLKVAEIKRIDPSLTFNALVLMGVLRGNGRLLKRMTITATDNKTARYIFPLGRWSWET